MVWLFIFIIERNYEWPTSRKKRFLSCPEKWGHRRDTRQSCAGSPAPSPPVDIYIFECDWSLQKYNLPENLIANTCTAIDIFTLSLFLLLSSNNSGIVLRQIRIPTSAAKWGFLLCARWFQNCTDSYFTQNKCKVLKGQENINYTIVKCR